MGKGLIVSGGAGGLYQVQLAMDTERLQSLILSMRQILQDLTYTEIPLLIAARNLAGAEKDAASADLEALILSYREGGATRDEVIHATSLYAKKVEAYRAAAEALRLKELQKSSLEKKLSSIEGGTENPVISAWCADLSTGLSGEVGTIEIPGERGGYSTGSVHIQPGYGSGAAYSGDRDGILQPLQAGTPANVFNNLAMLPAWQKYRPTYRIGKITSLGPDWSSSPVTLEPAFSSQQGLAVNQAERLSGVPFDYMGLGVTNSSTAFDRNSRVMVKFIGQDWGSPLIIGFAANPQPGRICAKITGIGQVLTPELGTEIFVADDGLNPLDVTYVYDSITQYWKITISDLNITSGWLFYRCSLWMGYSAPYPVFCVQYPHKPHVGDWLHPEDRIGFGYFEDIYSG